VRGFQAKATLLLKWYCADKGRDELANGNGLAFDIINGLATTQLAA
jgi:hypothetical protein